MVIILSSKSWKNTRVINFGRIKVGRQKTEVPNFLTSEEAVHVAVGHAVERRSDATTVQVESLRSLLDPKRREDANPDFEGATVVTLMAFFQFLGKSDG